MAKSVFGWIMPILIVGALLVTLGTFKRSQTLTTDEQKKLNDYQQTNLKYIKWFKSFDVFFNYITCEF